MPTPLSVLLVEDSAADAELLLRELRRAGYEPTSDRVESAATLRAALERTPWDLVISDHGLPAFSAPEALALVQETGVDVPLRRPRGRVRGEAVQPRYVRAQGPRGGS